MTLTLPSRAGAPPLAIDPAGKPIIVVGANGSGKTRFTARLRADLGAGAFELSALKGLFSPPVGTAGIAGMYAAMPMADVYREPSSLLDCLIRMLLQEEITTLMATRLAAPAPSAPAPTRMERLVELWRLIFPGNCILVESGRMLLNRSESGPENYSPLTLSTGEKAVMFFIAGMLFAPQSAVVFVDDPTIFLHPTVASTLWSRLEAMRPDCVIVYTTHDLDFAASRQGAKTLWVRSYSIPADEWTYELIPAAMPDEVYTAILGSRRNVLFIEGDGVNSIDAKLYPLIFSDYTVKSLGSCNKVIEATRSFNDLVSIHRMKAHGIVDRDRRDEVEVSYLRRKGVFVPDVAEIENILMLEEVIRAVAARQGKNEDTVFAHVRRSVMERFRSELHRQALEHTRHRIKRLVEYKVDGRFTTIADFERHISELAVELAPGALYGKFCSDFKGYLRDDDYESVLRVFNQKSMIPASNVAGLCGLRDKEEYVGAILAILRSGGAAAGRVRRAITRCFGLDGNEGDKLAAPAPAKTHDTPVQAPADPRFPPLDHGRYSPKRRKGRRGRR